MLSSNTWYIEMLQVISWQPGHEEWSLNLIIRKDTLPVVASISKDPGTLNSVMSSFILFLFRTILQRVSTFKKSKSEYIEHLHD